MMKDDGLLNWIGPAAFEAPHYWTAAAGASFVVGAGLLIRHMRHR